MLGFHNPCSEKAKSKKNDKRGLNRCAKLQLHPKCKKGSSKKKSALSWTLKKWQKGCSDQHLLMLATNKEESAENDCILIATSHNHPISAP